MNEITYQKQYAGKYKAFMNGNQIAIISSNYAGQGVITQPSWNHRIEWFVYPDEKSLHIANLPTLKRCKEFLENQQLT